MQAPTCWEHQLSQNPSTHWVEAPTSNLYKHPLADWDIKSPLAPPCHPGFLATTRRKLQLPVFKHQLEPWGQQSSLAPPYLPYLLVLYKRISITVLQMYLDLPPHSALFNYSTSALLSSVMFNCLAHSSVPLLFAHSRLFSLLLFICSASLSSAAHS